MIPSVLASEIQTSVMEFLATEFQSSNPQFQGLWDRFFTHPENLFKGPYLSIFLPFRPSPRDQDFFPDVPMKFKPHLHQELAFISNGSG